MTAQSALETFGRERASAGYSAMRIYGANGTAAARAISGPRRGPATAFSVDGHEEAHQSAAAGSPRAVTTVDALLALQGVEDFTARKKRAVAKGRRILDALDGLRTSLLRGSTDGVTLRRLEVAAEGLAEQTGDGRLDAVLNEISLRAAVELAKAGLR